MKNLLRFKIKDNLDYTKWFINNKFIPKELNINEICLKDKKFENIIEKDSVVHEYIFTSLLILIFKEKYENKKKEKNKAFYYIHKNHYDNQMIFDFILNDYKKYKEINKDKNKQNKYAHLSFENYIRYIPLMPVFSSFLIQVYIYYQNNNYPKVIITNKEDEKLQFEYDLREGEIEGKYSYILFPPIRIEPRINKILLFENQLNELSLFEIGKVILFNKNIKTINCKNTIIRNNYIDYLNEVLGIFDNYGVEELKISNNFLKENSKFDLSKLISHLKGLKTLNLSTNYLKNGLSSFLVILKKLYRKKNKIRKFNYKFLSFR